MLLFSDVVLNTYKISLNRIYFALIAVNKFSGIASQNAMQSGEIAIEVQRCITVFIHRECIVFYKTAMLNFYTVKLFPA